MSSDPIANDERGPQSYWRLCSICGAKVYKVIVGNIIDYRHSSITCFIEHKGNENV